MKHRPGKLPKILQWSLAASEALIAVGTAFLVIFLLFIEHFDGGSMNIHLGEVRLTLPADTYTLRSDTLRGEALQLRDVTADLRLRHPEDISGYLAAVRGPGIATVLFVGAMMFGICELLRRLFKNVSRGDAFTEANVKNLHKIGVMILLLTFGGNLLASWTLANMAGYLSEHVEATGIEIDYTPTNHHRRGLSLYADYFVLNIDAVGIFGGLLVLALGEAFRQGLKLREENDLTI